DDTHINADLTAVFGLFNSQKNYGEDRYKGGSSWREGFIQYGISADRRLGGAGTAYGKLNWTSSGTWGDGDAGGFTDGSERTTKIEDALLGWRSGDLLPALGPDGLDFSFGRQIVTLGDGFIINDDGLNFGNDRLGAEGSMNRGGGYYLAARRAFDRTAVLKLGGEEGLHGSLLWLKSDNRAQAETELAAATLAYSAEAGTLEATWIHGLDVTDQWADEYLAERDGMDIYSLRGAGNAGIENANFAFEYARQEHDSGAEKAWYLEAGYTLADLPWTPNLTYRYSRYSKDWDALFNGFNRGYGTWFQGEVAANYAGPFNSNVGVHHLNLSVTPRENITAGVLYFDFETLHKREDGDYLNLSARELNLYMDWAVSEHLIISPLVGWFTPKKSADDGGSQVGGNGTNFYSQLVFAVPF
ncbi:TPA: hypothetical protein ACQJWO_005767, partial [Klebsiella pneumoniae]